MDGNKNSINDKMKAAADGAIKEASEKFGQNLDFSENSIVMFENLLDQVYQSLSHIPKDEQSSSTISQTADMWGSYLGEYMRLKWDGTWKLNGSDRLVYISNILFSPIHFVYQKITSHPEYSVEFYLSEVKRLINVSVINTQEAQYMSIIGAEPKKQISFKLSNKPITIDKRTLFSLAGIGGLLLLIVAFVIGYNLIKNGGISAFGFIASPTSLNTNVPLETTLVTATFNFTDTPFATVTLLPTYTPEPTITPQPSLTPSLTYTQIATLTSTNTQTPFVPTRTRTPAKSPTSKAINPTETPVPPPVIPPPPPTATLPPPPTEPPPVVLESCEINPSTVQAGVSVPLTFIAHFFTTTPGYGFVTVFDSNPPGQNGCSGSNSAGDGTASCVGSSGLLPNSTVVVVTFSSSVGDCVATYRSQ